VITTAALQVLSEATFKDHSVILPPAQLKRELYEEVNEVLTRLGGKWKGGKTKAHLFPYDPAPLLAAVLDTGSMPPKNPTAFFPTPQALVDKLLGWIEWLPDNARILEPSAGTGAFADAIKAMILERGVSWQLECCEVLDLNRSMLEAKGHAVVAHDFMQWQPEHPYDLIVMNPPFSLEGDKTAYITHINHAYGMLKEDGQLIAIAPPGFTFRSDAKTAAFADMIMEQGEYAELGAGAFSESGTGVNTYGIWLRKQSDQSWRREPMHGWPSWHAWACNLWVEDERELHDRLSAIAAKKPADMAAQVRRVYEDGQKLARKHQDPVRLDESDHQALFRHFCDAWEVQVQPPATVGGQFTLVLEAA
jgi:predicted RNA methylase